MKITVNSVVTVKSAVAITPVALSKHARQIVGKSVEVTLAPTQTVSDLNAAAKTAFAFDPAINITKVVCEFPTPLDENLTLTAAGIPDGAKVNCRFTVSI